MNWLPLLLLIAIPIGVAFLMWLIAVSIYTPGLARQMRGEFEVEDDYE